MTTKKGTEVAVQAPADNGIAGLLREAVTQGASPEALNQLADLYQKLKKEESRMAFFAAMSAFQAEVPPIPKSARNNRNDFAPIEEIERVIRPFCAKHGFSHTYSQRVEPDGLVTVTVHVRHIGGHGEDYDFTGPMDAGAKMNDSQKVGSANSYFKRYAVGNAYGLTFVKEDDDGVAAGSGPTISEQQVATLEEGIEQTGARRDDFLRYLGVGDLSELPTNRYAKAVAALDAKAKRNGTPS